MESMVKFETATQEVYIKASAVITIASPNIKKKTPYSYLYIGGGEDDCFLVQHSIGECLTKLGYNDGGPA